MTATVTRKGAGQAEKQSDVKRMTDDEKRAAKARMERLIDIHRKTFEKLAK